MKSSVTSATKLRPRGVRRGEPQGGPRAWSSCYGNCSRPNLAGCRNGPRSASAKAPHLKWSAGPGKFWLLKRWKACSARDRLTQQQFQILAPQVPDKALVGIDDGGGQIAFALLQLQNFLLHRIASDQAV